MRILTGQYELSKSTKNIYGPLCINHNEKYFPNHEWTDFPYPILTWWADSFITAYKKNSKIEMLFMDGEYCMIGNIDRNIMTVLCYDSYTCKGYAVDSFDCEVTQFKDELSNVLTECKNTFKSANEVALAKECESKIDGLSNLFLHS